MQRVQFQQSVQDVQYVQSVQRVQFQQSVQDVQDVQDVQFMQFVQSQQFLQFLQDVQFQQFSFFAVSYLNFCKLPRSSGDKFNNSVGVLILLAIIPP